MTAVGFTVNRDYARRQLGKRRAGFTAIPGSFIVVCRLIQSTPSASNQYGYSVGYIVNILEVEAAVHSWEENCSKNRAFMGIAIFEPGIGALAE